MVEHELVDIESGDVELPFELFTIEIVGVFEGDLLSSEIDIPEIDELPHVCIFSYPLSGPPEDETHDEEHRGDDEHIAISHT